MDECPHNLKGFSGWEFLAIEIDDRILVKCTLCGNEVTKDQRELA